MCSHYINHKYWKDIMKQLKKKYPTKGKKIYRGYYNYQQNNDIFCEEEFEVFSYSKNLELIFLAVKHFRLATGEVLRITMKYTISKSFMPKSLFIEKAMGKSKVLEVFQVEPNNDKLLYTFNNTLKENVQSLKVPPKFTIATPFTCTSMIHLKSKKENTTSKNYYHIISSINQWEFLHDLVTTNLVMERSASTTTNLNISTNKLKATSYKVYDSDHNESFKESGPLSGYIQAYISKHNTIPYLIESTEDNINIEIRYLNDLSR